MSHEFGFPLSDLSGNSGKTSLLLLAVVPLRTAQKVPGTSGKNNVPSLTAPTSRGSVTSGFHITEVSGDRLTSDFTNV